MNTLELNDDKIMMVWDWCSDAYLQHGIRLKLPANTDHTKTYQWRYARSIAKKFAEWDFDEPTAKQFIQIAIRHCKNAGVLRKGLASLHQTNLLQVCYDQLKGRVESNGQSIESIAYIHSWLQSKSSGNLLQDLLDRNDPDEYCNIVKWVNASKISRLYLALSKTCGKALARLGKSHPDERMLLPKTTTLYMLRSEFIEDSENLKNVKKVLGNDWRELCQ
jgi:hypothetical protein